MEKDASLTIRLPRALKVEIERKALEDARSVSSYCTLVLMKHLGIRNERISKATARAGRIRSQRR